MPTEFQMPDSQRAFVSAVTKYCASRAIKAEVRSGGWLIVMQRGPRRHFAYGYDLGLNSAVTHRIANDKAATAEILQMSGVACVPHALFLGPQLSECIPAGGSWQAMLHLLQENPRGLVVKPNEGTSGNLVFKVRTQLGLELAVNRIFSLQLNLAISPYLEIEDEVRVILVDDAAVVVYSKRRPTVTGDGVHSLLELARAAAPAGRLSAVLQNLADDPDHVSLETILPAGQIHTLNWRHNLDSGAEPVLLKEGTAREACVEIAIAAAKSIGMRFGSIDVVRVDDVWRVLEINSGVMMEAMSKRHPELVEAAYGAALDKVFG
jgi:glutathione synthase/RimK-type ligase-like ATP-grasp enzyme